MAVLSQHIAVDADDGSGRYTDTVFPPTGGTFVDGPSATDMRVIRSFSAGNYISQNIYMRFDTSSIPDNAIITDASVDVFIVSVTQNNSPIYLYADYYDFGGSPAVAGDFVMVPSGSSVIGNTVSIGTLPTSAVKNFPLYRLDEGINKTGYTGIRWSMGGTGAPGSTNDVRFAANENASPEAVLNVTYYVPDITPAIGASGDDAMGFYSNATWPASGGSWSDGAAFPGVWAAKTNAGTFYDDVSPLRFDTSSLPDDATVVGAVLRMKRVSGSVGDAFRYMLGAKYSSFDGHAPTVSSDYVNITAGTNILRTGYFNDDIATRGNIAQEFAFVDLSGISKTGYTSITLGFVDDGSAPGSPNDLKFESYDSSFADRPVLKVAYTAGGGSVIRTATFLLRRNHRR